MKGIVNVFRSHLKLPIAEDIILQGKESVLASWADMADRYRFICMHVCMYVCMHVYMHVCIYVCMYVYMYACMYICMHVCIYVCMNLCVYA